MNLIKVTLYLSFLLLAACGGGSSGGSNSSVPTDTLSSSSLSSSNTISSSVASALSTSSSLSSSSFSSSFSSSSSSSKAASSSSSSLESSSASSISAPIFTLTSTSFVEDATIPNAYTCDGIDINPQLGWEGAPAGTKSFAVIVDDPDAFAMFGLVWVHWNIYNISASATELIEGASTHADKLPPGSVETNSDFGSAKYRGPCPPSGRHHYQFQIYALNQESINFSGPLTRTEFEAAFADSIIATTATAGYFR